ncbi:MAG: hypothetical protein JNK02_17620 [Planctomycetes bacterium]|nr:hypothetical protein [Planctomycetota bacterium]
MTPSIADGLRDMRVGVLLSLCALLFGFGMGGVFGAFEDSLKGGLEADAQAVLEARYGGDAAKSKAVVDKAWSYYKRAHMHGGGIGAATLAVILVLAGARANPKHSRIAAWALGFGALGYPIFWLLAGQRAPGLGSTGAAKESLEWLAIPTSGALLLGLVLATFGIASALFGARRPPSS